MRTVRSRLEDLDQEWGMANVPPRQSGLPGSIVVFCGPAIPQHGPRIEVSNIRGRMVPTDTFSVSIEDQPQVVAGSPRGFSQAELQAVYGWVTKNQALLLDYWNADSTNLDTLTFLQRLQKV